VTNAEYLYDYLLENHNGPENPIRLQDLVNVLHLDERQLRKWLETQEEYPITSSGHGYWCCTQKADWYPAIRFSVICFLAWKRRWKRQVRMMMLHHPRHGRLFDDEKYGEAA